MSNPDMNGVMKNLLAAERYAVVGRVMTDPSRWDHKVLKWYQDRKLEVVGVKPDQEGDEVNGLKLLNDVRQIPNLSQTSISIIIHPSKSLPILQSLFPVPPAREEPRGVWFQPGSDDGGIWEYVEKRGIQDKVVGHGECVLRDGDWIRADLGEGVSRL